MFVNKVQIPSSDSELTTWKIKSVMGSHKDELIDITEELSVGRESSNDLVIHGSHISRRHAELYVKNGQLIVRDLDSSNGTLVNGESVRERAVFLGDEIAFDSVAFRVAVGKAPPSSNENSLDKTQFRSALSFDDLQEGMTLECLPELDQAMELEESLKSSQTDISVIQPKSVENTSDQPLFSDSSKGTVQQKKMFPKTYVVAFSIFFILLLFVAVILFL